MHEDVCPYEIPSFEEVGLLAQHRNMLEHLWEKIKFSNWDYTIYGTNDDKTYFFTPQMKGNINYNELRLKGIDIKTSLILPIK